MIVHKYAFAEAILLVLVFRFFMLHEAVTFTIDEYQSYL